MTTERAIELLSGGGRMPDAPHSAAELDEACQLACEALRLYTPRMEALAQADNADRLVILPSRTCTDADGEEALRRAMWDCNYKNNGVTRFAADAIAEKLCREAKPVRLTAETPVGRIVARASTDRENPGIWVSLHKPGEDYEPDLALVEYTKDEADLGRPALITRVWRDTERDEYTDRVVHTGLEKGGAE